MWGLAYDMLGSISPCVESSLIEGSGRRPAVKGAANGFFGA